MNAPTPSAVSQAQPPVAAPRVGLPRLVARLLNVGHGLDHMMLLIFATAVTPIAREFGLARWEDLMPYSVGLFLMFGVGALPSGRLGDLWGRRPMMLVYFFGTGVSAVLVALTHSPWQMAAALTLLGVFTSIYHPIGLPMLVRGSQNPGMVIGVNGLAGNLGIAAAALVTGYFVAHMGWRAAFAVPGLVAVVCGILFAWRAPREEMPAHRRDRARAAVPKGMMARLLAMMTITAITSGLVFNFTTNGNGELLRERFAGVVDDPATLGLMLGAIYTVASLVQLVVGRLLDRYPLKNVYLGVVVLQAPLFALASVAHGWWLFALQFAFMILVFGAIPFADAMLVRYVDDSMRSRVSGVRLALSFGISSLAVWSLGPVVKAGGFVALLLTMAAIALLTLICVLLLPTDSEPV